MERIYDFFEQSTECEGGFACILCEWWNVCSTCPPNEQEIHEFQEASAHVFPLQLQGIDHSELQGNKTTQAGSLHLAYRKFKCLKDRFKEREADTVCHSITGWNPDCCSSPKSHLLLDKCLFLHCALWFTWLLFLSFFLGNRILSSPFSGLQKRYWFLGVTKKPCTETRNRS